MMKDPHNYKARLESTLRRIRESKVISKKNKEAMLRFKDYCLLEISVGRTVRYLECLVKLSQWMKVDFEDATLEDVKAVVAKINAKEYSEWTKQLYKVTLKKFYRWLKGGEKYPEEVEWIRTTVKRNKKKLPEDLLTEEEIEKYLDEILQFRGIKREEIEAVKYKPKEGLISLELKGGKILDYQVIKLER
jgi:site-specific recombinase XerD